MRETRSLGSVRAGRSNAPAYSAAFTASRAEIPLAELRSDALGLETNGTHVVPGISTFPGLVILAGYN